MHSSKMVRAGEGGMTVESMRATGYPVGLTRADEAVELVRERQLSGYEASRSTSSDCRDFQRPDMVETRELMRERPLVDVILSGRRFLGEWGISMLASVRS